MDPAHQLNNDILLLIFSHLNENSRLYLKSALTISHVCAHWRTLTVNHCPGVWRVHALRIPKGKEQFDLMKSGTLPEFNKEMIRRSQDLDLEYGRDEIMQYSNGIMAILKESSSKLGWLSIPCPNDYSKYDTAMLRVLEGCHVPRLKHLDLSDFEDDLPNNIFGGDLSSLTSLALTRSWLNIQDMRVGKNLCALTVSHPGGSSPGLPTHIAAWLPILRKTPNITRLELDLAKWNSNSPPQVQPSLRISLSQLTRLDLTIYFVDLEPLCDCVSIPPGCQICINVPQYDPSFAPDVSSFRVSDWIKRLAAHHAVATPHGYRLRITELYGNTTFILADASSPDVWDEPWSTGHRIYLSFGHTNGVREPALREMLEGWALGVGPELKVACVTMLYVRNESAARVLRFIGEASGLEKVEGTREVVEQLMEVSYGLSGYDHKLGLEGHPGIEIVVREGA